MNKELTPKIKEKIKSLTTKQKTYIYLRALMVEKNKQLSSVLHKKLSNEQYTIIKAELLHFLYDGNTNYGNSYRYNRLLSFFQNRKNVYDLMDNYSLCSYILYYDVFIKNVFDAHTFDQIQREALYAYNKVSKYIERDRIHFNSFNDTNINLQTYLKSEYRYSLLNFLKKELKLEKNINLINLYLYTNFDFALDDDINERISKTSKSFQNNKYDNNKIYANQVEEYIDENGNAYYLDHEGNLIQISDIEDFKYENEIIKATKKGLKISYNYNEEYTK